MLDLPRFIGRFDDLLSLGRNLELAFQRVRTWSESLPKLYRQRYRITRLVTEKYEAKDGELVRVNTANGNVSVYLPYPDREMHIAAVRVGGVHSMTLRSAGATFNGTSSTSQSGSRVFAVSDGNGIWWTFA